MFNYAIQVLHEKRIELIDLSLRIDDAELREQIAELEQAMWSLSMVFESTDKQPEITNMLREPLFEFMKTCERIRENVYKPNIIRKKRGWDEV